MPFVRFVTMDDKKVACWCETNMLKMFRDFMQYILDSCNNPKCFLLWDVENNKVYNAYQVATEVYEMRKRSFDEKINNIQTGKWAKVNL